MVWVGDAPTDLAYDLRALRAGGRADGIERIKWLLRDKGVLFRPW